MTFKDFSTQLIESQDLDPDYVLMKAIIKVDNLSPADQLEWIINKIFIYDTASELKYLIFGKAINTLKFGSERRKSKHDAVRNIQLFKEGFNLQDLPKEYTAAKNYLTGFPGVGDWAAWKFCDLLERVYGFQMDFSQVDFRTAYIYPLRGLCRVNQLPDDFAPKLKDDNIYNHLMSYAWDQFPTHLTAPPGMDRKVNIQELETCLCKYHSFLSGHYSIGKDTFHLNLRFKEEELELPMNLLHTDYYSIKNNPLGL